MIDLNPANQNDLPAIAAQYGLNPTPIDQVGTPPTFRMQNSHATAQNPCQLAVILLRDTRILQAEPNRLLNYVETFGTSWTQGRSWAVGHSWAVGGSSKGYGRQWFPDSIRLDQAHTIATGSNVIVAVLDTGIDLNHPAFAGKLVPGFDFVSNDNDPGEEGILHQTAAFGHGTHVAGIVRSDCAGRADYADSRSGFKRRRRTLAREKCDYVGNTAFA